MPHDLFQAVRRTDVIGLQDALDGKAGTPYRGIVPSGTTTPVVNHQLGTQDVYVSVWRVADGVQVGVPVDRIDDDNVQLTFATAPLGGEYRVIVSAGTGQGGGTGGGGEGGTPDPHAASHASNGTDPVSPASIGAASALHSHSGVYSLADHTHSGVGNHAATHASGGADPVSPAAIGAADALHDHGADYAAVVHNHSGMAPNGGATGQVLTKNTDGHFDFSWQDPTGGGGPTGPSAVKPYPPVTLTAVSRPHPVGGAVYTNAYEANAAMGTHFRIRMTTSGQSGVVVPPVNPTPGQIIMYEITAAGGAAQVYFDRGWGWIFGDAAWVARINSGVTDYVTIIYDERNNGGAGNWKILSVSKNFPLIPPP